MSNAKEISIKYSDGEQVHFSSDPENSIFEAARNSGVGVAHDCLNGTCGTCKGSIVDGTVEYSVNEDELALPNGELGAVLLCQAKPVSDRVNILLSYSRASLLPERKRKLKILSKVRVSDTVWDIRCKAEGLRMFDFLPGQYVRLTPAGAEFTRAYSPYTAPGSPETGFLIRELKSGAMSEYLRTHPDAGDIWNVSGPYGIFYRRHTQAASLYIAGGTGLAPILSMLRAQQKLKTPTGPKKVFFGVTKHTDLFYVEELKAFREEMPELSFVVTVFDGPSEIAVGESTVVDVLSQEDLARLADNGAIYLCGPPGMVEAVRNKAQGWGFPTERIFTEEFVQS